MWEIAKPTRIRRREFGGCNIIPYLTYDTRTSAVDDDLESAKTPKRGQSHAKESKHYDRGSMITCTPFPWKEEGKFLPGASSSTGRYYTSPVFSFSPISQHSTRLTVFVYTYTEPLLYIYISVKWEKAKLVVQKLWIDLTKHKEGRMNSRRSLRKHDSILYLLAYASDSMRFTRNQNTLSKGKQSQVYN